MQLAKSTRSKRTYATDVLAINGITQRTSVWYSINRVDQLQWRRSQLDSAGSHLIPYQKLARGLSAGIMVASDN